MTEHETVAPRVEWRAVTMDEPMAAQTDMLWGCLWVASKAWTTVAQWGDRRASRTAAVKAAMTAGPKVFWLVDDWAAPWVDL